MKINKQIIIKASVIVLSVLSVFTVLFVINNKNMNNERDLILEEVTNTFMEAQETFIMHSIQAGEPSNVNAESKGIYVLHEAQKSLKEKHNISIQDFTSEAIKEDGDMYIKIEGYIKSKLFFPSRRMYIKLKNDSNVKY